MTSTPRISIIVPSFNHRRFLPVRMDSILNQTRQDFELILLDDASQDGSGDYLETFLGRPGVRLIRNTQNTGSPFAQWNRGLSVASGDLVRIAESDDVASPRFLEVLAGILDRDPTVGLVFCRSQRIDEEGVTLSDNTATTANEIWHNNFQMDGRTAVSEPLYLSNIIVSASAVVFRRELYEKVGPAKTSFRLSGDWMQWCEMLLLSDLSYVSEPLSGTRIHTNTRRHSTVSNGTLELESLAVQSRLRDRLNIQRRVVRRGAEAIAISWLQAMRAGRYSGSLLRNVWLLWRLLRADLYTGFWFAIRWPYAFLVWLIKRFLLVSR